MAKSRINRRPAKSKAPTPIGNDQPISILNWNASMEDDPKTLARYARSAATLAHLASIGLKADEDRRGDCTTDREYELVRDASALTDLLCFKLARQLGAGEAA